MLAWRGQFTNRKIDICSVYNLLQKCFMRPEGGLFERRSYLAATDGIFRF